MIIGTETDHGLWVGALVAAGYSVFAVNPLQASRYRERHGVSGAKSDAGDAHMLTDMVRTDSHQLRAVAGGHLGPVRAGAVRALALETVLAPGGRQVPLVFSAWDSATRNAAAAVVNSDGSTLPAPCQMVSQVIPSV